MLEITLIVGIFIISYILALKNINLFVYVLLIFSVLLHKELFSFQRWDLLPIRGLMLALVAVCLTRTAIFLIKEKNIRKGFDYIKSPYIFLIFLLWVVRGISIFFSKNLIASLSQYAFFTTVFFLISFLYVFFVNDKAKILRYLKFYISVVFILTLFGYLQAFLYYKTGVIVGAFWNVPGYLPRIGATFWDVNHYAALLASVIPLAGVFILTEKGMMTKCKYALYLISFSATLLLSNSRTALILEFCAVISFLSIVFIRKYGSKGISIMVLILCLIFVPMLVEFQDKQSPFRAKIKEYFQYRIDSFASHFMLLKGSYEIFEKYPIFGGGYGSFFEHFSETKTAPQLFSRDPAALNTRVPAHTIWGELISETGILGLSIFILLFFVCLTPLLYVSLKFKETKDFLISASMFSSVLGWLVAGIFYSYNAEFFWIVVSFYFLYGVSIVKPTCSLSQIFNYFLKSPKFNLMILLLISAGLMFTNLGTNHLVPWDEAIYAKISKNMVLNKEYMVQYWNPAVVWYEKPPLYMWFMALCMRGMGPSEFSARLPSAFFGFLTVLLVFFMAKKLFNKSVAFISALSLVTTVHFLYYSRSSMLDVTTTFFITFSLFSYYLFKNNQKGIFVMLSGVSLGLAVMTKGIIGFIPIGVISFYELYLYLTKQQKLNRKILKSYLVIFLSSAVIFLPWHLAMIKQFGSEFLKMYLGYHVWDRAVTSIEDKGRPFYWYFIVMKVSMRLWFIALVGSVPVVFYKIFSKRDVHEKNKFVFVFIWSLFILAFFSLAKSKVVWYIIPIYPVVCLFVGYFVDLILGCIYTRIPKLSNVITKMFLMYVFVITALMYLFYNREMVYQSDLTGPQARLLELKDTNLGTDDKVVVDRIELPVVMYYTNGPFEIMDFEAKKGRIPTIEYVKPTILLTKSGRFTSNLPGITEKATIVSSDGDYILYYFDSQYKIDKKELETLEKSLSKMNYGEIDFTETSQKVEDLKDRINLGITPPVK